MKRILAGAVALSFLIGATAQAGLMILPKKLTNKGTINIIDTDGRLGGTIQVSLFCILPFQEEPVEKELVTTSDNKHALNIMLGEFPPGTVCTLTVLLSTGETTSVILEN